MNNQSTASILRRLRALSPNRGLDEVTAMGIAERQATLLLQLTGQKAAPVPLQTLRRIPSVVLEVVANLPASGASYWTGTCWRLEVNAGEHPHRQRFTFCHEFKHVIDHPNRDLLYAEHRTRERVANHFAACLLMPRRLVTQAWCSGEQDLNQLASLFSVSTEAMTTRLLVLGLLDHRPSQRVFCTRGATKPLHWKKSFAIAGGRSIGEQP